MASKAKDVIAATLFICLGVMAIAFLIPTGVTVPESVEVRALSPDFWPYAIAWAVVVSSAFLLLESIFLPAPEATDEEDNEEDAQYKLDTLPATLRMLVLVVGLFAFYYALTHLGIVASSIILMPTLMFFFGERNWRVIIPLSLGIPLGLYFFFLYVAGIPMPLGIFESWVVGA